MRPPPQPRRPPRDLAPAPRATRPGSATQEPGARRVPLTRPDAAAGTGSSAAAGTRPAAEAAAPAARAGTGRAEPAVGTSVDTPPAPGRAVALATPSRPAVSTGFTERQAERESARRRLLLRRVLLTLAVLVALGAAVWALLFSPLLALDRAQVGVTGTGTTVDAADVLAVVEPRVGVPLPRVDVAGVRAGIEEITTVRTAQVTRAWPRGLEIVVEAREPVAVAASPDGFVLLDGDGVQIGTQEAAPEELPLVTVPLDSPDTAAALDAVLTVLAGLPPEMLADVTTAAAAAPRSVTLVLSDGAEVRWGSAEETELKAAVLAVLREQPARVYDLTVPRSPTTLE